MPVLLFGAIGTFKLLIIIIFLLILMAAVFGFGRPWRR